MLLENHVFATLHCTLYEIH